MADNNVSFRSLDGAALRSIAVERPVGVGISMARLQRVVAAVGDQDAPRFAAGSEPNAGGLAFTATDGSVHYNPALGIGPRAPGNPAPDVWLLTSQTGTVSLHFTLVEAPPAGLAPEAEPFAVRVDGMAVLWAGGRLDIPEPTLEPIPDATDTSPAFLVRGGVEVPAGTVTLLEAAMRADPACRVEVTLSYGFWVETPTQPTEPTGPRPRPPFRVPIERLRGGVRVEGTGGPIRRLRRPSPAGGAIAAVALRPEALVRPVLAEGVTAHLAGVAAEGAGGGGEVAAAPGPFSSLVASRALRRDVIEAVLANARQRETRSDFRRITIARTVGFVFDPSEPMHRAIYRGLRPGGLEDEGWVDSGAGMIRPSSFPNTLFRVPDELRLAFNPDLGTPYVLPTIYRGPDDADRVRVLLRAVPWHDPRAVQRLREVLETAPLLAVGGYESAEMKLTGAFPEQLTIAAGTTVAITVEQGVELSIDVTLEFYQFLAELLTSPIGITGEVAMTLAPPEPPATAPLLKRFPVRLALGSPGPMPVEVRIPTDTVCPTEVTIVNTTQVAVRIGACVPWLLEMDPNAVTPLEVHRATTSTPFPLELAPGAEATITVAPADATVALWNAVELQLVEHEPALDPRDVLERVHELAPNAGLQWRINVEAPILRGPLPPEWSTLFGVEVEIWTPDPGGAAPVKREVILTAAQPTGQIVMPRTLRDLLDGTQGLASFTYRSRTIHTDHQGPWGPEQVEEGSNLFVFPQREAP